MYRLNKIFFCVVMVLLSVSPSFAIERLQTNKQLMRLVIKARKTKVFTSKRMIRFALEKRNQEVRRERGEDDAQWEQNLQLEQSKWEELFRTMRQAGLELLEILLYMHAR